MTDHNDDNDEVAIAAYPIMMPVLEHLERDDLVLADEITVTTPPGTVSN